MPRHSWGIEVGHELIVITWMHEARRDVLKNHPRGDESRPLTGVFHTRSPARPNPLGLHPVTVREGRRAIELLPVENDSTNGAHTIAYLAIIAAWAGENDLACEQLARATQLSGIGPITYGQLKLLSYWDPLRADPHFQKIVVSLAPKDR